MANEKVLVIDDIQIVRKSLKRELEQSGYLVDCVESGEKALEIAKEKTFDIVLIDLMMPGMNGLETCQALSQLNTGAILILMTGNLDNSVGRMEEDFLKYGGKVHYLYKPFNEGEVLDIIKKALKENDNQKK